MIKNSRRAILLDAICVSSSEFAQATGDSGGALVVQGCDAGGMTPSSPPGLQKQDPASSSGAGDDDPNKDKDWSDFAEFDLQINTK